MNLWCEWNCIVVLTINCFSVLNLKLQASATCCSCPLMYTLVNNKELFGRGSPHVAGICIGGIVWIELRDIHGLPQGLWWIQRHRIWMVAVMRQAKHEQTFEVIKYRSVDALVWFLAMHRGDPRKGPGIICIRNTSSFPPQSSGRIRLILILSCAN